MRHRLVAVLLVLLAVGACDPVTPTLPLADTPAGPAAATPTPPSGYAETPAAYTSLAEQALARGAEVSALVAAGDALALFARFDAALQAEVPLTELESTLSELATKAPIGERLDARFVSISRQDYYAAAHAWGEGLLGVYASFDPNGMVNELELSPLQPALDPAADHQSAVPFRLPFDGPWYVAWGGPDELHNYHVTVPFQRYAYDLTIWKDGGTCRGDCTANEDYYVFGQPILAPADGEVVAAVGDQPDQPPGEVMQAIDPGNYLILLVGEGEYLFIGHMQQGSLQVSVGDQVQTGQVIGRVGNSGRTSEPHIHIHLQDSPRFALSGVTSLPLFFTGYLADDQPVERGMPLGSQFVRPQP